MTFHATELWVEVVANHTVSCELRDNYAASEGLTRYCMALWRFRGLWPRCRAKSRFMAAQGFSTGSFGLGATAMHSTPTCDGGCRGGARAPRVNGRRFLLREILARSEFLRRRNCNNITQLHVTRNASSNILSLRAAKARNLRSGFLKSPTGSIADTSSALQEREEIEEAFA